MEDGIIAIKTAVISTANKTDLIPLCRTLHKHGVQLFATHGSARILAEADIPAEAVESLTKTPEAFNGRMKTLSFHLCAGILFRRDDAHDRAQAAQLSIPQIDLIVTNPYPFHQRPVDQLNDRDLVELIDVGGPTMMRSAAKNYAAVALLSDPEQYGAFIASFRRHGGGVPLKLRKTLAAQAFALSARYEAKIAQELGRRFCLHSAAQFPLHSARDPQVGDECMPHFSERRPLRYGENPQQQAWLLADPDAIGIATGKKLQGKGLSYNNYLDADAALRACSDLQRYPSPHPFSPRHSVVVVKHQTPCGAASAREQHIALERAWEGDAKSAFGSVICFSHAIGGDAATWLSQRFIEVVIAPEFSEEALNIFAGKKNLRLLQTPLLHTSSNTPLLRSISGGCLLQQEDHTFSPELQCMTEAAFPDSLIPLAQFGIVVSKHLKSNAIALVQQSEAGTCSLVGAGMGQPNRVDSFTRLAWPRFRNTHSATCCKELVLVSDGFFPFADIVHEAAACGIKYLVQPGGSIRDHEVIKACNDTGISMLCTGTRHFLH